jgi:hypothetical protein
VDPDRSATDEASWHWVTGISPDDLEAKLEIFAAPIRDALSTWPDKP